VLHNNAVVETYITNNNTTSCDVSGAALRRKDAPLLMAFFRRMMWLGGQSLAGSHCS